MPEVSLPLGNRFVNATGVRFGKLVAKEYTGKRGRFPIWRCLCDCGKTKVLSLYKLRSGHTKSCGCLKQKKLRAGLRTAHGQSKRGAVTKTYTVWATMIGRCCNPKDHKYAGYGGRGITVCKRWRDSFENFLADMGEKPDGMSIDRVNNDGNYEPDNCRWATATQQARNTRRNRLLTVNGETRVLAEWCEKVGLRQGLVFYRLKLGWTPEEALGFAVRAVKDGHTAGGKFLPRPT